MVSHNGGDAVPTTIIGAQNGEGCVGIGCRQNIKAGLLQHRLTNAQLYRAVVDKKDCPHASGALLLVQGISPVAIRLSIACLRFRLMPFLLVEAVKPPALFV